VLRIVVGPADTGHLVVRLNVGVVASRGSKAFSVLILHLVLGADTVSVVIRLLSALAHRRFGLAAAFTVVLKVLRADASGLFVVQLLGLVADGRLGFASALAIIVQVFRADTCGLLVVELLGLVTDWRLGLAPALPVIVQVFRADTCGLLMVELLRLVTLGGRSHAASLLVVDKVVGALAHILVRVENLGRVTLRSAHALVVGFQLVVVANTVTFLIPVHVFAAFLDALVIEHLVPFLAYAFLLMLAVVGILATLGDGFRLGMRYVALSFLDLAALGATGALHIDGTVRTAFPVALALIGRAWVGFVAAPLAVLSVRTLIYLVVTGRLATGRVLLEAQIEDVEPAEVDTEVETGHFTHAAHVYAVLLGPPTRQ